MERKELESQILELVSTAYNVELDSISMDTDIKEDLGGASVLMVGLVSEIENELDVLVQLPVAAACKTIKDLTDKVEELLEEE